jgi:hypothetical protein
MKITKTNTAIEDEYVVTDKEVEVFYGTEKQCKEYIKNNK